MKHVTPMKSFARWCQQRGIAIAPGSRHLCPSNLSQKKVNSGARHHHQLVVGHVVVLVDHETHHRSQQLLQRARRRHVAAAHQAQHDVRHFGQRDQAVDLVLGEALVVHVHARHRARRVGTYRADGACNADGEEVVRAPVHLEQALQVEPLEELPPRHQQIFPLVGHAALDPLGEDDAHDGPVRLGDRRWRHHPPHAPEAHVRHRHLPTHELRDRLHVVARAVNPDAARRDAGRQVALHDRRQRVDDGPRLLVQLHEVFEQLRPRVLQHHARVGLAHLLPALDRGYFAHDPRGGLRRDAPLVHHRDGRHHDGHLDGVAVAPLVHRKRQVVHQVGPVQQVVPQQPRHRHDVEHAVHPVQRVRKQQRRQRLLHRRIQPVQAL
ncbi:OmpA family protein [Babesia caballi]|uniref:OmpA family protein n=1 Tax=Babesia caballi TaxID=5871 RepID=A0AAV4LZ15_BABCB|nr:OmpA family protein [Babesia caballi]